MLAPSGLLTFGPARVSRKASTRMILPVVLSFNTKTFWDMVNFLPLTLAPNVAKSRSLAGSLRSSAVSVRQPGSRFGLQVETLHGVDQLDIPGADGERIQRIGEFTDRALRTGRPRNGSFEQGFECAGRLRIVENCSNSGAKDEHQAEAKKNQNLTLP